jgi:hypothetical protein
MQSLATMLIVATTFAHSQIQWKPIHEREWSSKQSYKTIRARAEALARGAKTPEGLEKLRREVNRLEKSLPMAPSYEDIFKASTYLYHYENFANSMVSEFRKRVNKMLQDTVEYEADAEFLRMAVVTTRSPWPPGSPENFGKSVQKLLSIYKDEPYFIISYFASHYLPFETAEEEFKRIDKALTEIGASKVTVAHLRAYTYFHVCTGANRTSKLPNARAHFAKITDKAVREFREMTTSAEARKLCNIWLGYTTRWMEEGKSTKK